MAAIERFWALDFDRCLARPSVLYDVFVDIVDQYGIVDPERLLYARRKDELSGGSFDAISYLFQEGLMTESVYVDVAKVFRAQVSLLASSVLEEGAADFISYLKTTNQAFGIVSYGNPRWQNLKIAASGLDGVPRMIVASKHKGRMIAGWYQPSEARFLLPATLMTGDVVAREVILVDDKAAAFDGLPTRAAGYWLQLSPSLLPSQKGGVPSHVAIARSYADVITNEEERRAKYSQR